MVLEVIRYLIANGRENQFETDYGKAAEFLDASPHCLGYRLARSGKEKNRYVMLIEWDSAEGHLQSFRNSPDFGKFFALVKPYFNMIEEMEGQEEEVRQQFPIGAAILRAKPEDNDGSQNY